MRFGEYLEHLGATTDSENDKGLEVVIEVEAGRKTIIAEPITAQFDYAANKVIVRAEETEGED